MINVTKKKDVPGSWINPNETVKVNSKPTYHIVEKGEVLSKIAKQYNTSVSAIMQLNKNIKDKDLIYPKQKIRVK
ncbi:LysM peptidoglycan-binding domain-containing protein [Heyndrickxia sporothermodurans]